MANLQIRASPTAVLGLLALVLFMLYLVYGIVAVGILHQAVHYGVLIYVLGIGAMVLGFASREDSIAVTAVIGLNILVILDIVLRIGVLPDWGH